MLSCSAATEEEGCKRDGDKQTNGAANSNGNANGNSNGDDEDAAARTTTRIARRECQMKTEVSASVSSGRGSACNEMRFLGGPPPPSALPWFRRNVSSNSCTRRRRCTRQSFLPNSNCSFPFRLIDSSCRTRTAEPKTLTVLTALRLRLFANLTVCNKRLKRVRC